MNNLPSEVHPLVPFLPDGARVLMLGSFPPKRTRWSMEFFYPNLQNDMWRIMGLIFFNEKSHFLADSKHFDRERIMAFCQTAGLALYDTASEVVRLRDNASDNFLQVVRPTDVRGLLGQLPLCRAVVTTGEKATETLVEQLSCERPGRGRLDAVRVRWTHDAALPHAVVVTSLPAPRGVESGVLPEDVRRGGDDLTSPVFLCALDIKCKRVCFCPCLFVSSATP